MPLKIYAGDKKKMKWIYPTTTWKKSKVKDAAIEVDKNFYIKTKVGS
jgi:hypothetical protein